MLRCTIALLSLGPALTCQVQTTTYVQESAIGGFGNVGPLGCLPTGQLAEARSQILIPAQLLPGPGAVLLGMAALGASSSGANTTISYAVLRVTVSPTSATMLVPTFASNLPSPQQLLNGSFTVNWQASAFTPLMFANSYTHDGTSSLVIDIQKIVSPFGDAGMKTIQNARRTDLPRMINTFGAGAVSATTATVTNNSPLSLQLRWTGPNGSAIPTLKLKSDPAAPLSAQFAIGRNIDVVVQGAPNSVFINLQSLGMGRVVIPGLVGRFYLRDPVTLNIGLLPANGQSTLTQTLPNNTALVGLYLAWQSLVAEQPLSQWRSTNAVDAFVNN
jgi:hypothetical protein